MDRTATYAIKGFIYQFNKTLLEILKSSDDSVITVEGIIEDIDIAKTVGTHAIQCKYHESSERFNLSLIYKPVLQMMKHFSQNQHLQVDYRLYAYFPEEKGCRSLSINELQSIINTTNKELQLLVKQIDGSTDYTEFSVRFRLEFGESFDDLVRSVEKELASCGLQSDDIETIIYPNALQYIVNLSVRLDIEARQVTKSQLVRFLKNVRTTAISRWTLSLSTRKKLLEVRKKQLKINLDKNNRLRYFLLSKSTLEDFTDGVVIFISEYLEKYHHKVAHRETPIFCFDCCELDFEDIRKRIHKKGIKFCDGYIVSEFDSDYFLREPIFQSSKSNITREFSVRLLRLEGQEDVLNRKKCDDMFIIGDADYDKLLSQDLLCEKIAVTNFSELKFVLGINNVLE